MNLKEFTQKPINQLQSTEKPSQQSGNVGSYSCSKEFLWHTAVAEKLRSLRATNVCFFEEPELEDN